MTSKALLHCVTNQKCLLHCLFLWQASIPACECLHGLSLPRFRASASQVIEGTDLRGTYFPLSQDWQLGRFVDREPLLQQSLRKSARRGKIPFPQELVSTSRQKQHPKTGSRVESPRSARSKSHYPSFPKHTRNIRSATSTKSMYSVITTPNSLLERSRTPGRSWQHCQSVT